MKVKEVQKNLVSKIRISLSLHEEHELAQEIKNVVDLLHLRDQKKYPTLRKLYNKLGRLPA